MDREPKEIFPLWSIEDQLEALDEGWRLCVHAGNLIVQSYARRVGVSSVATRLVFRTDKLALAYVESKANQGFALHERAMRAMVAFKLAPFEVLS